MPFCRVSVGMCGRLEPNLIATIQHGFEVTKCVNGTVPMGITTPDEFTISVRPPPAWAQGFIS
jgi:hypothetical protein